MAYRQFTSRHNESDFVIDEKRKILVNARNMTDFQEQEYFKNLYTTYRPDLSQFDYYQFKEKWKLGENFLNEMRKRQNHEIKKIHFTFTNNTARDKLKPFESQIYTLTAPHIRGARFFADRTWDEASKIVNFVDIKISRIQKYGLDYPGLTVNMTKEECEQKENQVADLLLLEMKKAPFVKEE